VKKLPNSGSVTRAIRAVSQAAKRTLKSVNSAAGKRMAKGDYAGAEALAAKGKEVLHFQDDVAGLLRRWREIQGGGKAATKGPVTPLWQYYQPVLQALVQAGGEARRQGVEPSVERIMSSTLQARDREVLPRGRERWREMVRRTHKPLVAEGWLDKKAGLTWRITEVGRRVAERGTGKEAPGKR
jgi:hypothetical protein